MQPHEDGRLFIEMTALVLVVGVFSLDVKKDGLGMALPAAALTSFLLLTGGQRAFSGLKMTLDFPTSRMWYTSKPLWVEILQPTLLLLTVVLAVIAVSSNRAPASRFTHS